MAEIPRDFHFVFGLKPQIEAFHVAYYLCLESCRRVNHPGNLYFHYHCEPYGPWWERIRPHLELRRIEPVDFIARSEVYWQHAEGTFIKQHGLDYAHQSDFIRLEILNREGGVYADIDTLFVKPLPDALFEQEFVLGVEGRVASRGDEAAYDSLCNAFILARPGARFGRRWLDEMYGLFDGTWDRHSCYGAALLSREMPDSIYIAPRRYFYRYQCNPVDISLLLEGLDEESSDLYSIHLWSHLWWEASRTDFTRFHKDLMTETHIREADTTYNVIARRYLD